MGSMGLNLALARTELSSGRTSCELSQGDEASGENICLGERCDNVSLDSDRGTSVGH